MAHAVRKLYKVNVVGQRKSKLKRVWWTVLVQARSREEACKLAVKYAESIADSSSLWEWFEWREISGVTLPMAVTLL